MAQSKPNQWRDSSREVKFFIFDSKLSLIFLIWILNITNLKLGLLLLLLTMFFSYLNYVGYNLPTFFRFIHTKLIKNKAYGKPRWFRRSYF